MLRKTLGSKAASLIVASAILLLSSPLSNMIPCYDTPKGVFLWCGSSYGVQSRNKARIDCTISVLVVIAAKALLLFATARYAFVRVLKNRVRTEGTENTEKRLKKTRGTDFQLVCLSGKALGTPTFGHRGVSVPSLCGDAIRVCTCLEKQGSHRGQGGHREKTKESSWGRVPVGMSHWERLRTPFFGAA